MREASLYWFECFHGSDDAEIIEEARVDPFCENGNIFLKYVWEPQVWTIG